MRRTLYFDCFSGASGDMILGALIDVGLPLEELRAALGSLALDGYDIAADRVSRAGVAATKFRVHERGHDDRSNHQGRQHHHHHDHHHSDHHHDDDRPGHGHHSLTEIGAYIDRSSLSASGKERAKALFRRLAEVEASIHQIPVDRVHLHEVGALDSIIDIVGAVFGLEWLGADDIVASPLNLGGGTVVCEHGTFPVPAPATTELVAGVPVYSSGVQAELVTPTGALLVTGYAKRFGPVPSMTLEKVGYGAGERDFHDLPNVLRVMIGRSVSELRTERIVQMDCEIDDMNPQIFGILMDRLYSAGALEVFYAPVQMKKGRPGTLVTILSAPEKREALGAVLFEETTTIGVRYHELDRFCLDRESTTIETPVGPIRFKLARRDGLVLNASPEFDDCVRAAAAANLAIKDVQAIAIKAYLDRKDR